MRHFIPILAATAGALLLTACGGADDGAASGEHRAELAYLSSAYVNVTPQDLRRDDEAMALAGQLFAAHCASCHGSDGTGNRGVTDLSRGHFDYGNSEAAIHATIRDGRQSEMPRMGDRYGEVELGQIVAYVETLSTGAPLNDYESRGKTFYDESCAVCHGDSGQGLTALGASDLTDDYWQHGDSMMNQRLAITRGVSSSCPSQFESLTPAEIDLLTAYVLDLSDS
jgi:cytochrome c oxidase cbb3-type subunit 3